MELKVVEQKTYRRIYFNFVSLAGIMVFASFLLVSNFTVTLFDEQAREGMKDFLIYGMILLSIVYSFYLRRQKAKLQSFEEFEAKLSFYEGYYRKKVLWILFSCAVSCILYVFVYSRIFLYLSLFEFVLLLLNYPFPMVFKKELQEDDIIFN